MNRFQQSPFPHESLERRSPPFSNHLKPIQINIGNQYLGERLSLLLPFNFQMIRNVQVDNFISVGVGKTGWRQFRRPLKDPITFQHFEQHIRTLLNLEFMSLESNLRLQWFLIRIINTCKMFQFSRFDSGILTLWIPLFQFLHWNIQEYFIKRDPLFFMPLPHLIPITSIRTNQANKSNHPRIRKQGGNLPRPPNGFRPISFTKGQITIQSRAEIIPIETIDVLAIFLYEGIF
mmetsp:Transcript_25483/g.37793  ORF Transcript_25483/g.37793 Transcript_25483/m.37793 type:complete len:233 (-) Transcript_25483:835-1533(-)